MAPLLSQSSWLIKINKEAGFFFSFLFGYSANVGLCEIMAGGCSPLREYTNMLKNISLFWLYFITHSFQQQLKSLGIVAFYFVS